MHDPVLADLADYADLLRALFEQVQGEQQEVFAIVIESTNCAEPASVTYHYSEAQDHRTMLH
jgi:hypothetical protein